MKRVLFITYHFPPDAEIGAVRPFQIVRRLHACGIESWILTVEPEFAESHDNELRPEGFPNERIIRTVVNDTWRNRLVSAWSRLGKGHFAAGSGDIAGPRGEAAPSGRGTIIRAARGAALALLEFPDKRIGWYEPALQAALELMARLPFDAVVSTSPPRVAHLIAEAITHRTRKPWVMDLRDPWYGQWSHPTPLTGVLRYAHKRLFGRCARGCTIAVANTERLATYLKKAIPAGRHVRCVPNGFDPYLLRARPRSATAGFAIGYFGQLMGKRTALTFLQGLRLWLTRSTAHPASVQVRFVGRGFEQMHSAVRDLGLGGIVVLSDQVSRVRAAEMMAESYVLLLIANDQPLQVPGKAYEYLAVGRRILALVDASGATNDLLRDMEGCVSAETPEEVANALETLWKEWRDGGSATVDRGAFLKASSYDRRAEEFALVIEEAIGTSQLQ